MARLTCLCSDLEAMARLAFVLLAVVFLFGHVANVAATRRKPKRRQAEPDEGGDRGAAGPGPVDAGRGIPPTAPVGPSTSSGSAGPTTASQNAGYRYCNDTVYAAGSSAATGSGARRGRPEQAAGLAQPGASPRGRVPAGGPGSSRDPALPPGSQTVVELTWQTADAQLMLQTDNPTMIEAAEWSAAISQDPPPARPDRSFVAAQVADRVAGMLVVLESGASPAVATDIENVLQPLVAAHGDAVLHDLIEGIMQAMSRRGISETRQRSMVAMLLFSMADPATPIRLASVRPGRLILSLTLWLQSSCAIFSCFRSYLTEEPAMGMRGQWLSSRCNRALFGIQLRQGSWFTHACLTDGCAKLTEHTRCGHQLDIYGACVLHRDRQYVCWLAVPDGLRYHLYVGIKHLPRHAGVTWAQCLRQASSPRDMSLFCVAQAGCSSVPASRSLRQCTHDSVTCFCMTIPSWYLSLAGRRELGVHPTTTDGQVSSFVTCPDRPVSLRASIGVGVWPYNNRCLGALPHSCGTSTPAGPVTGFQLYNTCHGRLSHFSGPHYWDLVAAWAPGARISSAQARTCLSRLTQVSMGVAVSFGLPSIGANSSTCLQSLLSTCFGSILPYRLTGTLSRLAPPLCLRSLSAHGLLLQVRRYDNQLAGGLVCAHFGGILAWSRRPWTQTAGYSHSVRSTGLSVASLFSLILSDAAVIWASRSAPASCHPCLAGLCSALFDHEVHMCLQHYNGRNYGCRCHRASWSMAVAQGPSHDIEGQTGVLVHICHHQVCDVVPPPTHWAAGTLHLSARISAASLCAVEVSVYPWADACHFGSGRDVYARYLCKVVGAEYCTAPAYIQQARGFTVWSIKEGRHAMGRGGRRGRRPHKSPASIERSKLRPGKRQRQALQQGAYAGVIPPALTGATSCVPASTATTPAPTPADAAPHTSMATTSRPALTTAPKVKTALVSTSTSYRLDPTSPSAPHGSAFSLLTSPKCKAAPASPSPRNVKHEVNRQEHVDPKQSLPVVTSAAPAVPSSSSAVASTGSGVLPAGEPASLPVHGPFCGQRRRPLLCVHARTRLPLHVLAP